MSGTGLSTFDGSAQPSDYMRYKDVTLDGVKYRAVTFDTYRKNYVNYLSDTSTGQTYQPLNGYYINNVYWFEYERLAWRVLDPAEGLVLCENIIDSQPFNDTLFLIKDEINREELYYKDAAGTIYANDYAKSSIRQWLNNSFYNTAFSTAEGDKITTAELENKAYDPEYAEFDSETTYDKVFMLTYADASNAEYGLGSDAERITSGTDYARAQDLTVSMTDIASDGRRSSFWRLRSAGDESSMSTRVGSDGVVSNLLAYSVYHGIRPALKVSLTDLIDPYIKEQEEPCEHRGGKATCTKGAICELCDQEYTEPRGHKPQTVTAFPATCTTTGIETDFVYCTACGKVIEGKRTVLPATGHSPIENHNAKAATCTEAGYTGDLYCPICNTVLSAGEVIPASGHTVDEIRNAKPATHKEEGYTGDSYCHCGALVEEGVIIPKTAGEDIDHEDLIVDENGYRDHKCDYCDKIISICIDEQDENGFKDHKCDICGKVLSVCVDLIADHKCDICGETLGECEDTDNTHYCNVCGKKLTDHDFVYTETIAPTCTQIGYEIYTCRCGVTDSVEIPATGHTEKTIAAVAPTCSADGFTAYKVCDVCGVTLEEGHTVAKLAHPQKNRLIVGGFAATCTEAGYTGDVKCTLCEDIVTYGHEIPATGHTRDEVRNAKEATHFAEGYTGDIYCQCGALVEEGTVIAKTTGEGVEHADTTNNHFCDGCGERVSYCIDILINGTTTEGKDHLCDICGATLSVCADENHNHFCDTCGNRMPGDTGCFDTVGDGNHRCDYCGEIMADAECADSDNDHYCDECGAKISSHNYEVAQTFEATCTKGAYIVYECSICHDTYESAEGERKPHDYEEKENIAASCTEDGHIDYECKDCHNTYTMPLLAKGHVAGEATIENNVDSTCTTKGSYQEVIRCTVCSETISTRTYIKPLKAHDYEETDRVEPTCGKNGMVIYTCSECGASKVEILKAISHNFVQTSIEEATCSKEGKIVYTCTNCGDEKIEKIPKTKHVDEDINGKCDECGEVCGFRCGFCSKYEEMRDIPVVGFFVTVIHAIVHFAQSIAPKT